MYRGGTSPQEEVLRITGFPLEGAGLSRMGQIDPDGPFFGMVSKGNRRNTSFWLISCTVEALNIASSATWDVDTDSLALLTACELPSPSYNVEALNPFFQAQHIARVGAADVMS